MKITFTFLALLFATPAFAPAQGLPPRLVDSDIRTALESAPLSMLFRGESAEDAKQWHDRFRSQLEALLGDSAPPANWKTVEEDRTEFEDHTRYALLLEAEGIPSLPVYLLVPKGLRKIRT